MKNLNLLKLTPVSVFGFAIYIVNNSLILENDKYTTIVI